MKVVFVLPIAYERFFHDSKALFPFPERLEDEVISKRNTWHFNWCNAMINAGMDVTFIHLSLHGKNVREYKHVSGIKIKRVPTTFRSFRHKNEFSVSLIKEIIREKPDIVYSVTHLLDDIVDMYDILALYLKFRGYRVVARNPYADTYTSIFSQRNNLLKKFRTGYRERTFYSLARKFFILLKVIYTELTSRTKYFVKKVSLRNTALLIPQTNVDYDNLSQRFGLKKDQLFMMPKPVDTSNFFEIPKHTAAGKLNLTGSDLYILHVSNLFNTKGCEHIINIMPELLTDFPNLKLIVSGGGAKKKDLEELAGQTGISEKVYFVGQVDHKDLVYYYNLADVFVLPTEIIAEGIPNAILESIACNTPPISTNLPGPSTILRDGLGLTIDTGIKGDLYKAIRKVLDGSFTINNEKRIQFLSDYSLENVGIILKRSFENIIKNS